MYRWPGGGAYGGEWRQGVRCGLGVRTWRTAEKPSSAGRWQDDALVEPLAPRDLDAAVEGALQAAEAARESGTSSSG